MHAAKESDPPYHWRTIRKANPSLDHLPDLAAQIRLEIEEAKKDKQQNQVFRALRLNLGISEVSEEHKLLLDSGVWQGLEQETISPEPGTKYVLGLDLGTSASLSAASAAWLTGELDGFGVYSTSPDLLTRGQKLNVGNLLQKIHDDGDILLAGEHVADIGALMEECLRRWGQPMKIVCDAWRYDELRQVLSDIGFPVVVPIVKRRMGWHEGSMDTRAFRTFCLSGKLKPRKSLALRVAMASSRVLMDPGGNSKLDKRVCDDLAVSSVLAVAEVSRTRLVVPKTFRIIGCKVD